MGAEISIVLFVIAIVVIGAALVMIFGKNKFNINRTTILSWSVTKFKQTLHINFQSLHLGKKLKSMKKIRSF